MYIQEVVIDGFKSYAQRTVIEGYVVVKDADAAKSHVPTQL